MTSFKVRAVHPSTNKALTGCNDMGRWDEGCCCGKTLDNWTLVHQFSWVPTPESSAKHRRHRCSWEFQNRRRWSHTQSSFRTCLVKWSKNCLWWIRQSRLHSWFLILQCNQRHQQQITYIGDAALSLHSHEVYRATIARWYGLRVRMFGEGSLQEYATFFEKCIKLNSDPL